MPRTTATDRKLALGLALGLGMSPALRAAPGGDQLWRFYADFSVTVVAAVEDLSGNGGKDLLVGSADDTLYLVEGRGAGKGAPLWAVPFQSTVSAAIPLGDVNGDGRADMAGGDELGFMQAINGGTGKPLWRILTFGAVLSAAALPDLNGDGAPEVAFGSENDTVYCFSGKTPNLAAVALWRFHAPVRRGQGGGPGGNAKLAAGRPPTGERPTGINSLALLRKGAAAHGLVAGASNDTVYCLPPAGGAALWKRGVGGDAWQVAAFPDVDGDGIEEALVACGLDIAFLLKGSDGSVLWSRDVSMGAVSVAAAGDMTGDGKPDALIGDGGGRIHCVPGTASGPKAAAAWAYDFGDTSTVHSLAALGDVDGDGRADLAAGTSHDMVAVLSGKGQKLWSANLGGSVLSVANLGDLDGNGKEDVAAGTEAGFAAAYQGFGTTSTRLGGAGTPRRAPRPALVGGTVRVLGARDLRGRSLPAPPAARPPASERSAR